MRLVCPNCGAQYEVDDRVVPDGGRDVQCSSCGHAWYQMPAHMEPAEDSIPAESESAVDSDDEALAEFEPEFEPGDEPDGAVETVPPTADANLEPPVEAEARREDAPEQTADRIEAGPRSDTAPDADDTAPPADHAAPDDADAAPDDEDAPRAEAPEGAARPRRDLDENLRAILQEEVAREMAARAADTEPAEAEPQPDLAGAGAAKGAAEQPGSAETSTDFEDDELPDIGPAPDHEREAGVFAAAPGAAALADKASRRDLFPDIEEINSTLDSRGPAEDDDDETADEGRSGFGRGFFAIIFIAALALALYLVAPRLAATVPALEPVLTGYVGAVNGARDWLDTTLQGLTSRIGGSDQP